MTPTWHAQRAPDAPAIVMSGSGAELLASKEIRAAYLEGGH